MPHLNACLLATGGVYCNGGQGIAVVNTVIYEPGGTVVIVDTGGQCNPYLRLAR